MDFEQIYEDSHKQNDIDFNKIYENAHEEGFSDWYETYNSRKLKESIIQESKNCEAIPHEKMSKVYRIFESYVDDEEWTELRETIIDLENLEKKIFHQGFGFALKEDQSKILENYAKSYTFDTNMHLVESYDSIELWNNDKRRKELDTERRNPSIKKKIFESLNDEWLKDEVKSMIQHITEAGAVNFTPEQQELKDAIRDITKDKFGVKFKKGTFTIFDKSTKTKVDIATLPKGKERLAIKRAIQKFEASQSTAAPVPPPTPVPNPAPNPTPTVSKEKEVVDFIEGLQISVDQKNNDYKDPAKYTALASSVSLTDIKPFTWEKISEILLNKFKNIEQETAKAAFTSGGTASQLDKQLKGIDKKAAKKFYDINSQEIRLQMLKSMDQAEIANDPSLIAEMKELEKKNSTFGRLKSKVLNFIRQKAPVLGKIISFAGAAFGIATKFGTITAIFAPLGPLAPVVGLVVSIALFFIQKAIFNLAGKATDKIVEKLFGDFLKKYANKRGPVGFICKKLSSPNGVAVSKLIVRVITTMIIAKPTANMLTGLVQKMSGPMISGLTAVGITGEAASKIIPDGLEGKLDKINSWAEDKGPAPIDPEKKFPGNKGGPGLANQTAEEKAFADAMKPLPDSGTSGAPVLPTAPGDPEVIKVPGQPTQYSEKWITINNPNQAAAGKDIGSALWKANDGRNWDFEPVPGNDGYYTAKLVPEPVLQNLEAQRVIDQAGNITSSSSLTDGAASSAPTDGVISPGSGGVPGQATASIPVLPPTELASRIQNLNLSDGINSDEKIVLLQGFKSVNSQAYDAAKDTLKNLAVEAARTQNTGLLRQITDIANDDAIAANVLKTEILNAPGMEFLRHHAELQDAIKTSDDFLKNATQQLDTYNAQSEQIANSLNSRTNLSTSLKRIADQYLGQNWGNNDPAQVTEKLGLLGINDIDPNSVELVNDNLLKFSDATGRHTFGILPNGRIITANSGVSGSELIRNAALKDLIDTQQKALNISNNNLDAVRNHRYTP